MIPMQNTLIGESLDLGPLYEPEAVEFSFATPGWYVLGALLLLLLVYVIMKAARLYVKNAYRRSALRSLTEIEEGLRQDYETGLREVLVLLKRVAMEAFGRETVAPLHGDDWLEFLEEKGKDTPFREYGSTIFTAVYAAGEIEEHQLGNIIGLCKRWIKTHA